MLIRPIETIVKQLLLHYKNILKGFKKTILKFSNTKSPKNCSNEKYYQVLVFGFYLID